MKWYRAALALWLVGMVFPHRSVTPTLADNGLPYATYTYASSRRQLIQTQDAYLPLSITVNLGDFALNRPQDIVVGTDDIIYIADSGRKSVIRYDLQTDEADEIGLGILNQPTGVHVDESGAVYVADFGNKLAYQFRRVNGIYLLTQTYQKPNNSPFFTESDPFDPTKIVTDRGGNVYVLLAGNINGLAQFKNDGEFFGYFGGNRIPATWDNTIRSLLFDEATRRNFFQILPKPLYNLSIDRSGLILTSTKDQEGYLKLNIANIIFNQAVWGFNTVEDIAVGPYNTIYTLTSEGYIVEYDPNGSVLFLFSGPDSIGQKGLFKQAKGIAVDSRNNLYAIDEATGALQIFIPTEFAYLVHQAIDLYFQGQYAASLGPWQEVLKMNRLFDLANQGLGDAYYALQDYNQALVYYRLARDQRGYSNAYWEVRNQFLLTNGNLFVLIVLGLMTLYFVRKWLPGFAYVQSQWSQFKQRPKPRWLEELTFPVSVFKKPIDGYDDLKRHQKFSNRSAWIYLGLFFATYLLWLYETNFLFNGIITSEINLIEQLITVMVPFGLWVVSNYLVCSIRDGDGRFQEVFQGSALTLLPMIIVFPLLTFISHGLTLNEAFIYDVIYGIGVALTVIYFFVMVKEIHFYDIKPTFKNILITIFTAIMLLAMTIIVFFLLSEVYQLLADIVQEVSSRG
jgi:DNA-binding beta-propeller fold protein YncE